MLQLVYYKCVNWQCGAGYILAVSLAQTTDPTPPHLPTKNNNNKTNTLQPTAPTTKGKSWESSQFFCKCFTY